MLAELLPFSAANLSAATAGPSARFLYLMPLLLSSSLHRRLLLLGKRTSGVWAVGLGWAPSGGRRANGRRHAGRWLAGGR